MLTPQQKPTALDKNAIAPEMVPIPAGTFWMGSNEPGADRSMRAHEVIISGFHLSKYEVTASQFCVFLNGWNSPSSQIIELGSHCTIVKRGAQYTPRQGCANHPANCISWLGALEYTKWLGKREGRHYRLPTEAEWEFAARGPAGRPFPWSSVEPSEKLANFGVQWRSPAESLVPVNSMPAGATPDTGIFHMGGTVREWCLDYYDKDFYKRSPKEDPKKDHGSTNLRVLRGGGFETGAQGIRATLRYYAGKEQTGPELGFRVVRIGGNG